MHTWIRVNIGRMRYRRLGSTGLRISEIGFGGWGIGRGFWKDGDDAEAARALRTAAEAGVNFFDTALGYGRGHSERLIGSLLRRHPGRLYVATKIPPMNQRWPAAGPLREAFPSHHIEASIERSRRNLGVDCLDLVQLHVWHPDWIDEREWSETLQRLQASGKLRFFGVSATDHDPDSVLPLVERKLVDTVQVIYNIFDQQPAERLFPACRSGGIGVLARVPLDEGGLTGKLDASTRFPKGDWRNRYFTQQRLRELEQRVRRIRTAIGPGIPLPEVALRFCLQPEAVSTVLVGMRRVRHVEENVRASESPPLSEELLSELKSHRWQRNFY